MFQKDKRAYKRFSTRLSVNFSYGDKLFTGYIRNLSDNGMCINTNNLLPCKTCVTVLIHLYKRFLVVSARINRIEMTRYIYNDMGFEILNPERDYLALVEHHRKSI